MSRHTQGINDIAEGWTRSEEQKDQLQRQRDELLAALEPIVEYRRRVGPLGFQLEKLDDYLRDAQAAIASIKGAHDA